MRTIALALLALLASGCAAAWRGTKAAVDFTSEPPGARVIVDNQPKSFLTWCVTPCTLDVRRTRNPTGYVVEMGGRETFNGEMIPAEEDGGGWLLLAAVDGLLILPGILDLATATFWNPPDGVHLILPPAGEGAPRAVVQR